MLALGTLLSGLLPLGERALLAPHPAPRGLAHSRGGAARACSSSKTLVSARAVVVMAVRRPRPMQQAPRVQDDIPINEGIQFDTMRVMIDVPGEADQMLGVMSKAQALAEAEKLNLDLVLIAPKSEPPVCKIVSYDKFRYNREKKKKEQKAAASKGQELKELKMSYKIGEHDYDVRKKQAIRFLKQGNKARELPSPTRCPSQLSMRERA